jgi:hypothetical protein
MCANPNLLGGNVYGMQYLDPTTSMNHITTVTSLCYLSIYINHHLEWMQHVTIMAMIKHARLKILGINLLGNSIHSLNFLDWRKVYNTLIIPILH